MIYVQNIFSAGEFAPELYGRADADSYRAGVSYAQNFIPSDRGPLVRRPPTYRFGEVWNHALTYRFIPFSLSLSRQLLLVFASDDTMRIIDVGARAWVESSPGTPFSLSMGGRMTTADNVNNFDYAQSGKALFLAREDMFPALLLWTSNTSWALSNYQYWDGPFEPLNGTSTGLWFNHAPPSAATVMTSSAALFNASRDVGRLVRFGRTDFTQWAVFRITAFTSSTQVSVAYQDGTQSGGLSLPTSSPGSATSWRWGAFYPGSYPRTVAIFEDRLVYGGTPNLPETVFFSTTSGFSESRVIFSPTSLNNNSISDAEGFVRAPGNDDRGAGEIVWLKASKDLFIGSSSGTYAMTARSGSDAFGPLTATFYRLSDIRVSSSTPQIDAGDLMVIEAGGRRPMRLESSASGGGSVVPKEISFFSQHLFYNNAIRDSFKVHYPYNMVYFRLNDGSLVTLQYNDSGSDSRLVGLYRQQLGGAGICLQADNFYSTASGSDETWMLVRRTLSAGDRQQIEYAVGQTSLTNSNLVHLDHQSTSTWSGTTPATAPHYAGKNIRMVIDGADYGEVAVDASGNYTLPREPLTSLTIGYGYPSEMWTLPPILPESSKTALPIGRPIRIGKVEVLVLRSIDLESGRVALSSSAPASQYINYRKSIAANANPTARPDLFSGRVVLAGSSGGGADISPGVALKTETSYPLVIISIRTEYEFTDK